MFFNKHNTVKVRSVKSYDKNVFISKLAEAKWEKCFFASNINDAWFNYREICMNILDSVAPIKEIRIKQRTEPWISADILECIQIRDNRFQKFKKSGKSDDYKKNCKLRNHVQKSCKIAKSEYFSSQIEENKNNPKKLWSNFKSLGYQKDPKSDPNIILNIDGENCHEGKTISKHFNNFFTTIASKLEEKLPNGTGLYRATSNIVIKFYDKRKKSDIRFDLKHVTEDFVYKELCSLNISKNTGIDGIPARFLKDAAPILKVPITF